MRWEPHLVLAEQVTIASEAKMIPDEHILICREELHSRNAILIREVNDASTSLVGDAEINRGWELSVPNYASSFREYLETYTDIDNVTPQKWTDNPVASSETFTGRWRLAFVRRIRRQNPEGIDVDYIVQTLRKGYIESLAVGASLDYSEARLIDSRDLPAGTEATLVGGNTTENYITLQWNNISPYKIESIKAYINGLGADSFAPAIRGETSGTDWHRLYTVSKIEEDGSATLAVALAKPEYALKTFVEYGTANGSDVDYIWNCPKTLAQAVITAARVTGRSCTASYDTKTGTVDLVIRTKSTIPEMVAGALSTSNCQIKDYTSMYLSVGNPYAYEIPYASTQGITYNRDLRSNKDGTYDIQVTVRETLPKTIGPFTSVSTAFKNQETIQYRNFHEMIDAPSATGSGIYRVSQSINQDCSYDADLTYEYGNNNGAFTFESLETLLAEATTTQWRDSSDYQNVPEAPQGAIYRASNSLTEDGLYNSELEYQRSKDFYVAFDRSVSSLSNAIEYTYQNYLTVVPIAGISTTGITVQDSLGVNQDGTYSQSIIAIESEPMYLYNKTLNSSLQELFQSTYQNYHTIPDLPEDAVGTIYDRNVNGMNEDGTYNVSIRQSVSIKDTDGVVITSSGTSDVIYRALNITPAEVDEVTSFFSSNYGTNSNSVDLTLNQDGTRSLGIGSRSSGAGIEFERDFYWTQYQASCAKDLPDEDKEKYLVYNMIKHSYSLTGLQNWLTSNPVRYKGTGLHYAGKGKWIATLVTDNPTP